MDRFKGFVYGMIAASTFGLIPLFTLPTMAEGLTTDSILTYRMFLACLFVLILMRVRGVSLRTNLKELRWFAFLGFFYYGSAALLFQGYHTMSSGMATTLHFPYPIVFRQRTSIYTVIAIALGLSGVALLSLRGGVGQTTSIIGILLVLLSGLSYAIYLVTVNNVRRLREMDNLKLTFYAIFFSGVFFLTDSLLSGGIQPIPSRGAMVNLLLLALLPTLISNLALVRAIKSIGSTLTSVLGAMEPLTAIVMGVLFLGEQVSSVMLLGVILILSAVTIIVLSPLLDKNIADRLKRFAKK